ncbi:MAG: hypothetical protein CVT59_05855 [Actinobacteria bacterium HGW-Actinobacteria-1]|jgi:hypothetical protein|nr:MAG: hypothetical protein CVT59_05855 [Actinobacteria bacterium HGW-Actinobacteria-1]
MRHRVLGVALVALLVLCGCTDPLAVNFKGSLSREATTSVGVGETTVTPVVFKVAEKKDTVVAEPASPGTGGGTGGGASGSYYARVTPSGVARSTGTIELILMVSSKSGDKVSGAKAMVTCTYTADGDRQSKTYTMTTDAHGFATKIVDATPFDRASKVTISGYAVVNGTRVPINGVGYSTVDF